MSWIGPAAAKMWPLIKTGAAYYPVAKDAYDNVRDPINDAFRAKNEKIRSKKLAYQEAETVKGGSVLEIFRAGEPRWIVFSGDTAVRAYPFRAEDRLEDLIANADLGNRETPEARRQRKARNKARRAAQNVPRIVKNAPTALRDMRGRKG